MKYICMYDLDDRQNRKYVLSAKNKIDYILATAEKVTDDKIEIISVAETKDTKHQCARLDYVAPNLTLKQFFSFGRRNILTKALDMVLLPVYLFCYLLANTEQDETVIVYHSLRYCSPIALAKKIRKFRLILEMEEIYSDVSGRVKQRERELRFVDLADAFIFPTQLLDDLVNTNHKPAVIIHGTYQVESDRKCDVFGTKLQNQESHIIHCVYAGTLDPRKGGASAAAAAAEFLPENYHIHILGFGSDQQIRKMKNQIKDRANQSKAQVTYDGLLSGEDYIRFIQSCDIGLSTQNPDAAFNDTSFPSKILSYMANGLRVVSIRIPAIERSYIGKNVYYYNPQTPQEIAQAILSMDLNDDYNGREVVKQLDKKFATEFSALLQNK